MSVTGKKSESLPAFFGRYPALSILAAVTLMADICYMVIIPLVPLYFRGHFQVKYDVLIGMAFSAFVLSETLLKPVAGGLGDRFRRHNLILISLLLGAVTPYLLFRAGSPHVFIGVRLIDGIGAAIIWPSMIALFADITSEKDRATAMSIFTTCMVVSMGVGFTLSTFLKALFGSYNSVFTLMSVLMFSGFVVMLISRKYIDRSITRQKEINSPVAGEETVGFWQGLKKLAKDWQGLSQLGVLVFLAFMQMLGTSILTPTTFLFLTDELGWEEKEMWKAIIAAGCVLVVLAVPAGRLVDMMGKSRSVKAAMVFSTVCLGLMGIVREPWTMAAAAVGYGMGFIFGAPAWMALVTRSEWENMRGAIIGVVTAFQGAGAIIGPLIGTPMYQHIGHFAPFQACAFLLGICSIVAILFLKPISTGPAPESSSLA